MSYVAHSVAIKWQTMGIGLQKILRHSMAHFKLKFSYSDMWSISGRFSILCPVKSCSD
jgi:hypothetical protein